MALSEGTRVGPYEITAAIGAGGMGEKVYRALDTRLKRDVALKILPASFASDPNRLARFQREAEVLASLNHPNIVAVHDVGLRDGVPYIVSELVEAPRSASRPAMALGCAGPSNTRFRSHAASPPRPEPPRMIPSAAECREFVDNGGQSY